MGSLGYWSSDNSIIKEGLGIPEIIWKEQKRASIKESIEGPGAFFFGNFLFLLIFLLVYIFSGFSILSKLFLYY